MSHCVLVPPAHQVLVPLVPRRGHVVASLEAYRFGGVSRYLGRRPITYLRSELLAGSRD